MNNQQLKCFQEVSNDIEEKLREQGYMSTDLVIVAYFIMQNNIAKAKDLTSLNDKIDLLMKEVEDIINR